MALLSFKIGAINVKVIVNICGYDELFGDNITWFGDTYCKISNLNLMKILKLPVSLFAARILTNQTESGTDTQ